MFATRTNTAPVCAGQETLIFTVLGTGNTDTLHQKNVSKGKKIAQQ